MHGVLHQIETIVSSGESALSNNSVLEKKLGELSSIIVDTEDKTSQIINALNTESSNPFSKYYWMIFFAVYVGAYLFQ